VEGFEAFGDFLGCLLRVESQGDFFDLFGLVEIDDLAAGSDIYEHCVVKGGDYDLKYDSGRFAFYIVCACCRGEFSPDGRYFLRLFLKGFCQFNRVFIFEISQGVDNIRLGFIYVCFEL